MKQAIHREVVPGIEDQLTGSGGSQRILRTSPSTPSAVSSSLKRLVDAKADIFPRVSEWVVAKGGPVGVFW